MSTEEKEVRGVITVDRETFTSVIGEGLHTAFRKGVEGQHKMWQAISDLPDGVWSAALEYVVWGCEFSGVIEFNEDAK